MKIVHFFAGRVHPEAAKVGSVHVLYYLSHAASAAGHEVSWYLAPRKSEYENQSNGISWSDFGPARFFGLLPSRKIFIQMFSERAAIDLIHLHGPFTQENISIALWAKILGIPYVISSHGSFSPGAMKGKYFLKVIYKHLIAIPMCNLATKVHVHTFKDAEEARAFGVGSDLIVAEHGADHITDKMPDRPSEIIDLPGFDPERFNMLFLGRLDYYHKGLDLLLYAVKKLSVNRIHLYLIGPLKSRQGTELEDLIKELNLSDVVTILPPIYELAKKIQWYNSVDLFVHPSRFDVFPIAVFEALAAGCPVMVTPGTQADEFVLNHQCGLVADENPESIAKCIENLYLSPNTLSGLSSRAKAAVSSKTWGRTWTKFWSSISDVES